MTTPRPPRPHGRRYPWDRWFAALPVTLRRWEDFEVEPASFGINARLAAKARGLGVKVKVDGDRVTIEPSF